jgi:hypothetical protein
MKKFARSFGKIVLVSSFLVLSSAGFSGCAVVSGVQLAGGVLTAGNALWSLRDAERERARVEEERSAAFRALEARREALREETERGEERKEAREEEMRRWRECIVSSDENGDPDQCSFPSGLGSLSYSQRMNKNKA